MDRLFLFCEPFPKQPATTGGLSGIGEGSQKRRSFILSKTILGQVDGFTPVIDGMIPEVGAMTALVFGKAWRYCQMPDGVCKASQDRIADELGLSRATINTHISKLVEAGYLEDTTPDLVGLPHQYRDTGKANLSISFTGNVSKNLTPTCQKSLHPPVKNIDTKKELKKEIKEREQEPPALDFQNMTVGQARQLPTLKMYAEATDFFPGSVIWEFVHNFITDNKLTVEQIKAAAVAWTLAGYKQENVRGILEWTVSGIPEKHRTQIVKPAKPKAPEYTGPSPDEFIAPVYAPMPENLRSKFKSLVEQKGVR